MNGHKSCSFHVPKMLIECITEFRLESALLTASKSSWLAPGGGKRYTLAQKLGAKLSAENVAPVSIDKSRLKTVSDSE